MGAYLTDHKPVRQQWYDTRRDPLTGCTALHTAESVMDTLGPDTGAEAVAEFIRGRTDPGSYHDLVDSDSWIPLVDLKHAAFHDGTGSNNWALSLSFACRTTDWARMTAEKRRGFLRQGARAFANQQLYRRAVKAPLTRLRLISKAQSDRGESGLIYHGLRDPGRRTDPGVAAPNLFPLDEFMAECRAELARVMPDHPDADARTTTSPTQAAAPLPLEELDMFAQIDPGQTVRIPVPSGRKYRINVVSDSVVGQHVYGKQVSPGRVVGLFIGHPLGKGAQEWDLYVAETHNIEIPCSATSFVEVTNKGRPEAGMARSIAVSLTPAVS